MSNIIFNADPALRIGRIIEVSGNSIRVELDIKITELTRTFNGQIYSIGQIGSIIKIHFGRKVLFGYVRMLRMYSDILAEEGKISIQPGDDKRILEADLFGQGTWHITSRLLAFNRGIDTYPLPLQDAFLCLNQELDCIYQAAESNNNENGDPMISIGHYIGSSNAVCRANIDKLFGHHCAILGSTGSGKSGTVAAILHAVLAHKSTDKNLSPRIVIIDPHGEYIKAFGEKAVVFKAYNEASSSSSIKSEQLKLPYWLMSSDEFRSLVLGKTEFEATSQTNIIYQAITYARLLHQDLIMDLGPDPAGEAKDDEPKDISLIDQVLNFDRDKPIPFKLSDLIIHIDKVQGQKAGKSEKLATSSGRDKIDSILKKLKVLRSNPQLSFLMDEFNAGSPSLEAVLSQFVGNINKAISPNNPVIRIIDISGLPNEVAGPLTALISRLLFQYKLWQEREERERDPLLLVCEEAHRYVPNHGEAQYKEAQEAVRRIAKEGRKYGIGLMLVSQRPSDVEATVLSQCNSWVILRLTNASDQEHVSRFLPDSLLGLTKMLPTLTRREALFVGEAAALPSRIRINFLSPEMLPDSNDISFVKGWSNDFPEVADLQIIANRWTKQSLSE